MAHCRQLRVNQSYHLFFFDRHVRIDVVSLSLSFQAYQFIKSKTELKAVALLFRCCFFGSLEMSNIDETGRNRPENPVVKSDPGSPLTNLSAVRTRMDTLQQFLSESVSSNTLISKHQMDMVFSEISSAIHQVILNGTALLTSSHPLLPPPPLPLLHASSASDPKNSDTISDVTEKPERASETRDEHDDESEYEVMEIDAVELLAEHIHFCDICGKGFKRDANLRMHMRAHGNEYKTAEALAKPEKSVKESGRKTRFSCPFEGCNRNRRHKKFRALKTVTCVKNHFKRSHCPKTYRCDRCEKKCFSVISDLKSHYKQCGESSRWKCSCGSSFSRKDKLFGHVALFEGHMPEVDEVDEKMKGVITIMDDEDECIVKGSENNEKENVENGLDDDRCFEGLLDDFGSLEKNWLQDMLGSPSWNGDFF